MVVFSPRTKPHQCKITKTRSFWKKEQRSTEGYENMKKYILTEDMAQDRKYLMTENISRLCTRRWSRKVINICERPKSDLVSSPSWVPHYVHHWAPATGTLVATVIAMTTVVVELGPDFDTGCLRYVEYSFSTTKI